MRLFSAFPLNSLIGNHLSASLERMEAQNSGESLHRKAHAGWVERVRKAREGQAASQRDGLSIHGCKSGQQAHGLCHI